MRLHILLSSLLLAAGLAGCLDGGDPASDTNDVTPTEPEPEPFSLEGHPEFCDSESSCDFWDDLYHEYVVYNLDTTVHDVIVVPPVGPDPLGHTAAAGGAVKAWRDGVKELAAPWLNDSFEMNVYVLGEDIPSLDAVEDPEIIVISTAALGVLGIGLEPKQIGCEVLGQQTLKSYPVHQHGLVQVLASDCTGIGFTCFALNAGGMDGIALYDLVAHEVGHCLGAGHVGDALDFRARYAPVKDIMSYQNDPDHVHCVSNMNVRNLEGVYAHLLDQPEEMWLPAGSFMDFPPAEYMQVECENP